MWRSLALAACLLAGAASADEHVSICHGYSCMAEVDVRFTEAQLGDIRRLLLAADNAAAERSQLALAIGRLYAWAGEQSDIRHDKGGNYADAGHPGKMDCIDHSTSSTRLLKLLASRGYLRWHRVLEPEARYLLGLFANHYSAVIEEKHDGASTMRYVVDSWFVDNGLPAVILPLADWKKGAGPDV